MNESYSALGSWFEYLNDDCDYNLWSQYLVNKLKALNVGAYGCDVGCGNGYFTRALYRAGYCMKGVDISPQMLTVAKQKSVQEGMPIEFLLGDIAKLNLRPKVDFIVAVNDCVNYVSQDKLISCFKKLYSSLNSGGILLFDISSSNKIKNVLANNVFCEDREDISYMWFNTQGENCVHMDLTFFIREKDGKYIKAEESHTQYAHEEEDVLLALKEAGFKEVNSEGDLGKEKTFRINFIAKK